MKYGKILTAFMLALAMCLGLTACSGDNGGDSNDNNDSIQTPPPVIEEYDQLYFLMSTMAAPIWPQGGATGNWPLNRQVPTRHKRLRQQRCRRSLRRHRRCGTWMVKKDGLSCIVILSDGQWGLGERTQAGRTFVTVDRGQLGRIRTTRTSITPAQRL